MNKRISIVCLLLGMATIPFSADAQRRRRSGTTGQTGTVRTKVSSGLIAGYNMENKLFKNTSITLAEKRSVDFLPLLNTDVATVYDKVKAGQYEICIPCADIVLEEAGADSLSPLVKSKNGCYTLGKDGVTYTIATKEGALNTCGSKVRMTLNDMRSVAKTEVDSVVLNIVPASSAYDYAGVKLGDDPEIKDLINNYETAKEEAKEKCSKDNIMKTLEGIRGAMIGGTVGSGIAIATGGVDTALQITDVVQTANAKKAHQAQLDKFDKDIEKRKNDIAFKESLVSETQARIDGISNRLNSPSISEEDEEKKLELNIDYYTGKITQEEYDKKIRELETTYRDLKTKEDSLKAKQQSEINLKEKIQTLEGDEKKKKEKDLSNLQAEITALQAEITALQEDRRRLQGSLDVYNASKNYEEQKLGELTKEKEEYKSKWEEKNAMGKPDALDIASGALNVVSGLGNTTSAVTAGISAGMLNDLITQLSDCKKAVKVMQNAGIDLENGLADLMSADVSNNENQTKTDE